MCLEYYVGTLRAVGSADPYARMYKIRMIMSVCEAALNKYCGIGNGPNALGI